MAKKLDEIKEAISNTPTKNSMDGDDDSVAPNEDAPKTRRVSSDMDLWGRLSESRKSSYNNLMTLGENPTSSTQNLHSFPVIPENLYNQNVDVSWMVFLFRNLFPKHKFSFRSRTTCQTTMYLFS